MRIENIEALRRRRSQQGKGVLILTGHFGNWEVATIAGIGKYPQMRGRFHFVRRAIKPRWLDALVTRRFNQAGFGVIGKRGSLDAMLDAARRGRRRSCSRSTSTRAPPDGIEVEFFGHPAWTFRSLAIIALATGAPVVPATSWREPDGAHVMRFERADRRRSSARTRTKRSGARRAPTTPRSSASSCARPEQWYWVHRRWKTVRGKGAARAGPDISATDDKPS